MEDKAYCHFFVVEIKDKLAGNFNLSDRELSDIRPLDEVNSHELFPLTQLALYHLSKELELRGGINIKLTPFRSTQDQIPTFNEKAMSKLLVDIKFTSMLHLRALMK